MPPPKGTPNPVEGPGDYDVTTVVHSDTYPEIDPTKVNLSGKAVFITGGSRGIGRAMVLSFAKAGASHIAVGARSGMSQLAKDIEAAASSAGREPPTFLPIKLDVANGDSVQQAANEVDKVFGKLDVLVNNAGILGNPKLITESSPDEWWQVFDINLRGPYLIARAFLPLLLKGETKYVVNVASVGALIAGPTLSAYQTAKMALVKFSQFIDVEYASQGIVSFCIHPGNCLTDIVGGFDIAEDLKPVFCDSPEVSADSVVYLASEKRDWLGGRYINCTWDMPELMTKKDEIVKGDKLKVKFVY